MGTTLDLSADEIERVRSSFDQVWAISSRTSELFYSRLFASVAFAPALFQSDMEEPKQKFMLALALVVASLDAKADLDALSERLTSLHTEFGGHTDHAAVFEEALLWSLEQSLGKTWTPGIAAAWSKAFRRLSGYMIAA